VWQTDTTKHALVEWPQVASYKLKATKRGTCKYLSKVGKHAYALGVPYGRA